MSDNIESTGKTVDEAISEALLQLGARRSEVEITVLEEGRSGFLGVFGNRPARVLVQRKQPPTKRPKNGAPPRSRSRTRPQRSEKQETQERPALTDTPAASKKQARPGRRPSRPPRAKPGRAAAEPAPERRRGAPEAQPTGNGEAPGVRAVERAEPLRGVAKEEAPAALHKITTELMQRSGFPCRCEVKEGEYHLVKIVTDDSSAGVLIGRHGSTIDAIEHLVERMGSQAIAERCNMNLDINNYRRRREESLVERTRSIMARVKSTGREVHTEPLCARERRIIHLEVVKDTDLRTYTVATADGKHVVVAKAEAMAASSGEPTRRDDSLDEENKAGWAPQDDDNPAGEGGLVSSDRASQDNQSINSNRTTDM
jgi:spoIIIJ-associated protein